MLSQAQCHRGVFLLILASAWSLSSAYLPDVNIFTNYRTEVYNGKRESSLDSIS